MSMAGSITCDDCRLAVECGTDHDSGCNEIVGASRAGGSTNPAETLPAVCSQRDAKYHLVRPIT